MDSGGGGSCRQAWVTGRPEWYLIREFFPLKVAGAWGRGRGGTLQGARPSSSAPRAFSWDPLFQALSTETLNISAFP